MPPSLFRASSFVSLVFLALLLVGCGPAVMSEQLNSPIRPMPSRPASSVALLTQKPDRKFIEVSALNVWDGDFGWSSGTLFEKLRAYGGRLGCDAVVVVGRSDSRSLLDRDRTQEGYLATCIQYIDNATVAVTSGTAPSASTPPPTTGIVYVPRRGYAAIEIDGHWVRLRDERAVVTCGQHKVRLGGDRRTVDVPCGGTFLLD